MNIIRKGFSMGVFLRASKLLNRIENPAHIENT